MNNTIEDVLILKVPANVRTADARKQLRAGSIIGVVAYPADKTVRAGVVRVAIKDSSGADICPMQNVENYRSREAGYIAGSKPLDIQGGQAVTIELIADADFATATSYDFIFIYEVPKKLNCSIPV